MVKKTWKRELAVLLLLFICILAYQEKDKVVEILSLPIFGFVFAAFGMDWVTKQTDWGGPREKESYVGEAE